MSGLEQRRMDRLYALLKKEKDPDTAATLRWAIFTLEQYLKRTGPTSNQPTKAFGCEARNPRGGRDDYTPGSLRNQGGFQKNDRD